MKKKIAFAIENFSRYGGGAESYAVELAETMLRDGWEVHFFGLRWDGEPPEAIFHPLRVADWLPAPAKLLAFAFQHRRLVESMDFDVVLGFGNTISMNVYQSHGGVHWLTTHRKVYSETNPLLRFFKRLFIPLSLKHYVRHWIESAPFRLPRLPRIIAISEMIRKDYIDYYQVSPAAIDLVYNGTDTDRFDVARLKERRGAARAELGLTADEVVFIFVSYDLKKKGIEPLVRAAGELARGGRNFRVLVAGGQPYAALRRLIKSQGVEGRVLFTGRVKEIEKIYATADVLVLPTYYDACSLVVLEGMLCGLPAITTEYNGIAGILTDGVDGAVISHPPDHRELAGRMVEFLDRPHLERVAAAALALGGRYSKQRNHAEMLRICNEVAAGRRSQCSA